MRYRMLAIDLDGTLLDRQGLVSEENLRAIRRAQEAGVLVVPCTGRAWREAKMVLEQWPMSDANGASAPPIGVFVTGAVVGELASGASLDLATMEPGLVAEVVELLSDLPEALLLFREASLTGHDYLVTGRGELSRNTRWWFEATGASVHEQRELGPEDLHHTLRAGIVASAPRVREVAERAAEKLGARALVQHFGAVTEEAVNDPKLSVAVLEIFAAGVDKWRGLRWIAQQQGIEPEQIAAIGDQINDLAMIKSAGCGIAMRNAVDSVKEVADYITEDCNGHGVARAIENLLSERWG